jgi:hypothetical protein
MELDKDQFLTDALGKLADQIRDAGGHKAVVILVIDKDCNGRSAVCVDDVNMEAEADVVVMIMEGLARMASALRMKVEGMMLRPKGDA